MSLVRIALVTACVFVAGMAFSEEQKPAAAFEIRYSLEQAGNASLAVYEKESGRMLRTILSAAPRAAGAHSEAWDGLDMDGNPVKPGSYEWKLLLTPGLKAEYLLTLGTNPTEAPWASWPGNHGGVQSVAVDDTGIYLSSDCSEVPPGIIKLARDATKRLWEHGNYEAWQGGVSMAVSNAGLLQLQANGKIQVIDPGTGNLRATWDPTWKEATGKNDDKGQPVFTIHKPTDLAAFRDAIVVSYKDENLVRWLKPDGTTSFEVSVPEPQGVTVAHTLIPGDPARDVPTALVASKDRIIAAREDKKAPTDFITGLTAPYRLDMDRSNGEIVVAERGDSHQVKRFDKNGKLLKVYGKKGGRRAEGEYDQPTSFYCVEDIAADGAGGFCITEARVAPRRTAHFDRKGRIVREWYGGQMFFQYACPDPADPSVVWMDSSWGWIMQAKIDFKKRTWRVLATYHYDGMANGLIAGTGNSGCKWRLVRKDAAAYLIRDAPPSILKVDEKKHRIVPVAASGLNITHYWDAQPKFVKDLLNNDPRSKWLSYLWADRNGDALPQGDEVQLSEWSTWWGGWSIDDNFNVCATDGNKVYALDVTSVNALGAPAYGSWGKPREVLQAPDGVRELAGYGAGRSILRDTAGNWFAIFNDQKDRKEHHGWGWPADMFSRTGLVKWDAAGKPAWVVGRHANTRPNPPGQTHNPIQIVGTTHGCIVVGERVVQPAVVWDEAGLYVGTFFDNRADDGLPKEIYCWWQHPDGSKGSPLPDGAINYDCLVGGAIHTTPKGEVYWYAPGWNNNPVYRITGWDGWRRQNGSVDVAAPPQGAAGTGTGLKASYFSSRDLAGQPVISRVDEQASFFWKDGSPEAGKINANGFSIRWEGFLEAEFSEDYIFCTYAKDGARLWLDGNLIIDGWKDFAGDRYYHYTYNEYFTKTVSKAVPLQAGRKYAITLEYCKGAAFKENNESRIHLCWESTTRERQFIPKKFLYPEQR